MTPEQRHALRSLHLQFAPSADDLWHAQGAFHVPGVNDRALDAVMDAFADAERSQDSSPLGVVVQGAAGTGKTHLLGQARERVQAAGGFFFLVPLLDAAGFWDSARIGILDSLGRPAPKQETQLKELLWRLTNVAHDGPGDISRAERRAIIGEGVLTPEGLSAFVTALNKAQPHVLKTTHSTLRALVLLGVSDLGVQDIGQAFLSSTEDIDRADLKEWGISGKPPATAQECVRDISRLVALAGPAVLAIDQFDGLIAQSYDRATGSTTSPDNRDIEHVAGGMMAIRENMRRTAEVVACLPASWEAIRSRAVGSVADRFRLAPPLEGMPSADIGRAILERRFSASYRAAEFTPDYPSWPIKVEAFDDAPYFTPRGLLQRADAHVRSCVDRNAVEELANLTDEVKPPLPAKKNDLEDLDLVFTDYRDRAVVDAVLDHEAEDGTVPGLLSAALQAWIIETGEDEQLFWFDPPPGKRPPIHARLRQSIDPATDDERHWGFRAIASGNATAVQSRIKNACAAAGFGSKIDKRKLVLLRNAAWPNGVKTAAMVAAFEEAGGRTLPVSNADLRTVVALRDFLDDDHPDLRSWLVSRRPAHNLQFMRAALLNGTETPPAVENKTDTTTESTSKPSTSDPEKITDPPKTKAKPKIEVQEHSPTAVPLGIDDATQKLLDVELLALRKHTAIFAGSGSGKTVLIRRLVEECALRGVSSIVLDPNNDLARLGLAWPDPPSGWDPADTARADDYHANTEVVVWTPRRAGGRPLSFQPLPDFSSVVDDADEYEVAVESAFSALEPRALISGKTAKAEYSRAVLREALNWYGRQPGTSLDGFVDVLGDLPNGISAIAGAGDLAAVLGQNLRAAKVNDPMFGGGGTPVDPGLLMTPSEGYRARVSVISLIGLANDEQRAGFVNQLQMALFAWIKRNPAGNKPLGGLLVMDEAQNFAPSVGTTAATKSTRALSSQARKYGLGLVFATQAPRGIDNNIPGNAATQFYGLLNSSTQITVAKEFARVKGGNVPEISKLRAGNFYAALEGTPFHKITTPWCLSYHPHSPLTTEEVLELARRPLGPKS